MDKKRGSFSFGILSVITALLVLILASFAMLSLVTARNDLALSEKAAQSVTDYYKADRLAKQTALYARDAVAAGDSAALAALDAEYDGSGVRYTVPISSALALRVEFVIENGNIKFIDYTVVQK